MIIWKPYTCILLFYVKQILYLCPKMTFLSIYQYDKLNEACFVNKKMTFYVLILLVHGAISIIFVCPNMI
jgi:hypothetical protein